MFKLLKEYYSLNKEERKILNLTFIWLIIGFILARLVPLKWFNNLLGEYKKEISVDLDENQKQLILKFKQNNIKLKRRLPWKVKCFEEAIAAKKVLEKYHIKSTIYLGVAKKTEHKLIAHAWLKSGNLFITGKKGHKKQAIVGFYS